MKQLLVLALTVVIIVIVGISCERTDRELDMTILSDLEGIPMEYGELVAVTTIAKYPEWVQLWFKDEEGTIRMVRIHFEAELIHNDVKVIPRS
ncbi:MAG: hypothetical protein OEW00_00600 [candidate division Zixibacteria bacterium]|nr:hypothetical protein [candidate division Zixibacteria bacterium]